MTFTLGYDLPRRPAVGPAPPATQPIPTWAWDAAFAGVCLIIAAFRAAIVAGHGAPVGIDSGNWIALGHELLGAAPRSPSIVYPPVVPLLVTGATAWLGVARGVGAVTVLASLAPAVGVYLAVRSWRVGWSAAAVAGLVAASSATGEAAAWGGFPQLFGLGALVVFVALVDRWLRTSRVTHALETSLVLAFVAGTSHLVALSAAVAAGVLVLLHLLLVRHADERRWRWHTAALSPLLLIPSLPLVVPYIDLTSGISDSARALPTGGVLDQLDFLFRDFAALWRILVVVAVVTPFLLRSRRQTPQWMIPTSLTVTAILTAAVTRQPRFLNILPMAVVLAVAAWSWDLAERGADPQSRRALALILAVALGAQAVLGLSFFRLQVRFYGVLTPGVVEAMDWLHVHAPADATVAVSRPQTDAVLGWWAEALVQRRTLYASNLAWLNYEDERERARTANGIFRSGFPTEEGLAKAVEAGVRYVLVDKLWPGYHSGDMAQLRARPTGIVAFETDTAVVLRVPAP